MEYNKSDFKKKLFFAFESHKKKKFEYAEKEYQEILEKNPDHFQTILLLGTLYLQIKKYNYAKNLLIKALNLKPKNMDVHYKLAFVYSELKDYKKAINFYNNVLKLKPNHQSANNNLGLILNELKKFEEAIKFFKKVNSTQAKGSILKCLYSLNKLDEYKKTLNEFKPEDHCNIKIGALTAYISEKENIKNSYQFCKNPLDYFFKINLREEIISPSKFYNKLIPKLKKIKSVFEPSSTTTKNGYQTFDNIFDLQDKEIINLKKIFEKQILIFKNIHKSKKDFFITKWPKKSKLLAWYVRLIKYGHQKPHIHPDGWLSGVFYLKLPKLLKKDEGSIKLTLWGGYHFPENKKKSQIIYAPKELDLILFPSSLFHETIPFTSKEEREVIAFDVIPISYFEKDKTFKERVL